MSRKKVQNGIKVSIQSAFKNMRRLLARVWIDWLKNVSVHSRLALIGPGALSQKIKTPVSRQNRFESSHKTWSKYIQRTRKINIYISPTPYSPLGCPRMLWDKNISRQIKIQLAYTKPNERNMIGTYQVNRAWRHMFIFCGNHSRKVQMHWTEFAEHR